jgi:hypothetical protein
VALPGGGTDAPGVHRADVVLTGLDQAGPSFELRVFLNNPHADAGTEPASDVGYAGSVYVYGYSRPAEGVSAQPDPHPRIPMTRYVMATEAVRAAAAKGPTATVTLVPIPFAAPAGAADTTDDPGIDLSDVQVSVLARE